MAKIPLMRYLLITVFYFYVVLGTHDIETLLYLLDLLNLSLDKNR